MNSTVTYQCPNCSAGIAFNAEKQKFCCDFCLSEFTLEELGETGAAQKAEEILREAQEFSTHLNEFHCPSCGAEIVADESTAADFCYYCHNPILLIGRVSGQMRPHKVIPFKYDKKEAQNIFLKAAKKKWFLPRDFSEDDHIQKISGIYYPFWVTDADTNCAANATAHKVRVWTMGNYRYTETSRFRLERQGQIHFEDIVTSALSDADKRMLEGVLPYPSSSLEDFNLPYLSGYTAKKRNIDSDSLANEVRSRMNNYADTILRGTMTGGYSAVTLTELNMNVLSSRWEYSLMPIWILTYKSKRKNKIYTYAMNGFTGKIYGEYPFSIAKILAFAGTLSALAAGALAVLGGLYIW